tara:strand:- start:10562 stop:11344 length:783 start_codon:yes stop_codon:yes gene_type:complete
MKYGLTLFCDELAEFKTDQIALLDRVLESFEDVSQLRSRSVCSQNTNTMLQTVRSSYSDINDWCKSFTHKDKRVYAYVLCGLSELRGGGSYYWNDRHLESLIVELDAHGYEIILVTTHITEKNLKNEQLAWSLQYKQRCERLARKHSCDTLHIALRKLAFSSKEIERLSQTIAKDLKARHADRVVGNVKENTRSYSSQPKRRLRSTMETKTRPTVEENKVKAPKTPRIPKKAVRSNTEPTNNKPVAKPKRKTRTITIERF